jgi:hypothetical protein
VRSGLTHESPGGGDSVEWYTPPAVFDALGLEFDLDPCSPAGGLAWVPARRHFSVRDDGLLQPWSGRVWMNPPYGPHTEAWMRKLAAHGDGVALVFARTDTRWFHETVGCAHAVCFIAGRLAFVAGDGRIDTATAGAPSCLIAYGQECAVAVAGSRLGMTFAVRALPLLGQASLWEAA